MGSGELPCPQVGETPEQVVFARCGVDVDGITGYPSQELGLNGHLRSFGAILAVVHSKCAKAQAIHLGQRLLDGDPPRQ